MFQQETRTRGRTHLSDVSKALVVLTDMGAVNHGDRQILDDARHGRGRGLVIQQLGVYRQHLHDDVLEFQNLWCLAGVSGSQHIHRKMHSGDGLMMLWLLFIEK